MHCVGMERAADVASIRSDGNEQDRGNLAVLHDDLAVLGAEEEPRSAAASALRADKLQSPAP